MKEKITNLKIVKILLELILIQTKLIRIVAFAYVLIKCKIGFENQIIEELVNIPEVQEVKGVFGDWDIFVRLETTSEAELEDIITHKIRRIANITSTNSLSPIPSQGGK